MPAGLPCLMTMYRLMVPHLVYLVTQTDFGCVISEAWKTSKKTCALSSWNRLPPGDIGGPWSWDRTYSSQLRKGLWKLCSGVPGSHTVALCFLDLGTMQPLLAINHSWAYLIRVLRVLSITWPQVIGATHGHQSNLVINTYKTSSGHC